METTLTPAPAEPEINTGSRRSEKVALVGNPNVGKSVFFNFMSGLYVDVSNFPGTTVSISSAQFKQYEIFDTPGVYGVSSFNDEERAARDTILECDTVLNVVNALHLERDLFLTRQLIDMGKKITVFLNFYDEIKKRNIVIDTGKLSQMLGVPVFTSSATKGEGLENIEKALNEATTGKRDAVLTARMIEAGKGTLTDSQALLLLEGDDEIASHTGLQPGTGDDREMIYTIRRQAVNEIVANVEYENTGGGKFFNTLGRLSLVPWSGFPILLVILSVLYLFIGDVVSQRVVDFTENTVGKYYFEYYLKGYVSKYASSDITVTLSNSNEEKIDEKVFSFPEGTDKNPALNNNFVAFSRQPYTETNFHYHNPFIRLLFGEFGVVSMTITYLLFLLLPLVVAFYMSMAFLEDSGYLPRLATMMDRSLSYVGLNGKAVIPIMLGFGCVTMATITTRILGSQKERTIATAILQFVIPCSAQLAVIAVLLTSAGLKAVLVYSIVIIVLLLVISTILSKFLPGSATPLLLDLPMMRIPGIGNVMKKTYHRTVGFMQEAALWFFVGALLVGTLEVTGMLIKFQDLLAPITTQWLLLPKEAATAFVMGVVRRDFGAAGLFTLQLTSEQITVAIVVITIFVPCIASFMVMLKERGWKEGMIIWLGTWVTAFFVGGIVARLII